MLLFLPLLVSRQGVSERVYVDPLTLSVTPFEREMSSAEAFNGLGVIAPLSFLLPASIRAAKARVFAAALAPRLPADADGSTLRLIPFGV